MCFEKSIFNSSGYSRVPRRPQAEFCHSCFAVSQHSMGPYLPRLAVSRAGPSERSEGRGSEKKKKRECCAKRPRVLLPFHIAAIVVCYAATRDAICVQRVSGRAQNVAEKTGRNNGSFNYCSVFLKWRAQLFSDAIGVRI